MSGIWQIYPCKFVGGLGWAGVNFWRVTSRFRQRVNTLKHMSFLGKEVIREAEKEKDEESKCEREKRSCITSKFKVSLKLVTLG